MTKKCYYITYVNCAGASGSGYLCSESIVYVNSGGGCGGGYFVSADLGFNSANASELSGTVEEVSCSFCPGCCTDAPKYDCINGVCAVSSQYSTPGLYNSLSDCQAVCANGGACSSGKQCVDPTTFCPPGKVCLEQSEVNDINNLLAKISSEACH